MKVFSGKTLQYLDDPAIAGEDAIAFEENGAIAVGSDGRIAWSGPLEQLPPDYRQAERIDHGDCLIMPGFIDAHLHFPQFRMIAAYGKDLLDWLNRYTFPEESRFADPDVARPAATRFLDELARNGTTACLAFSTIHPAALDALFSEAMSRNMALASGRTMMDRQAPDSLRDTFQSSHDESVALIAKWHGKGRLSYAISPRFAVTSSEAQLEAAGALAAANPGMLMQTHLSESAGEIAAVASDFPWSKDYTDVYDRFGLLRPGSLFAHGIHLSERELDRMAESGSAIVHCPTSNNFLGSGLFRHQHTTRRANPVATGIGSDIGGGMSFSMFDTMRDAYTVSQLCGARITAHDAFHMATRGNARLLGLSGATGTLAPGSMADLVVIDPRATPCMTDRHELSQSLHDMLFALLIMADDRAVRETYIAGKACKQTGG